MKAAVLVFSMFISILRGGDCVEAARQSVSVTFTNSSQFTMVFEESESMKRLLQTLLPRLRAVSSSNEKDSLAATNAIDGNGRSRWSSERTDDEWIYVDMGAPYVISGVVISWETAFGSQYSVETSDDARNWVVRGSVVSGNGGVDTVTLSSNTRARYVRMKGIRRATQWGYSIYELQIQGVSGGLPSPTPPPTKAPPDSLGAALPPLIKRGDNGKPKSAFPLGLCMGDCDNDRQCRPGLKCFHRSRTEAVPGCSGDGIKGKDYCFDPRSLPSSPPPTPYPTPAGLPPSGSGGPHRLRLFWKDTYRWQESRKEMFYCAVSSSSSKIKIEKCNSGNTKWEFVWLSGQGDQIRKSGSNDCIELTGGRSIKLRKCDTKTSRQRWIAVKGDFREYRFDIRPINNKGRCLTQHHHPRSGEEVFAESCGKAHGHTTGYWNKY